MANGGPNWALSERLPGGFPQFFDEIAGPMMQQRQGMELFYGMVSPVESPHDTPQMSIVRANLDDPAMDPTIVVGDQYLDILRQIQDFGGYTTRLLVTPGPRSRLPASEYALMRAMYARLHTEGKEALKLASFTEQVPRLYGVVGDHTNLANAYVDGVRKRSPDGGFWALYENRGLTWPVVIGKVMYDHGVFTGFDIHRRDPVMHEGQTPVSLEWDMYTRFWHDVFHSVTESTAILPE